MARVLGIDEAGRGPVVGSMFIGGFMIKEEDLDSLEELGVKDSKKLSDGKRERLRERIEEYGEAFCMEFTAEEIDSMSEEMTINDIEVQGFSQVLSRADPDKVYMDLPEPDAQSFIDKVSRAANTDTSEMEFIAGHGADDSFPVVSAASIVAKSAREEHVRNLKEKYGYDFASGYPHDEPTIEFLKTFLQQEGRLPEEARRSWSTAQRILDEAGQESLDRYQ
jgi:ribonuclease HII